MKTLLILERSGAKLDIRKDTDGAYVLEGVFSEIGVKNRNNRIYEEGEFLPHINELQSKIQSNTLLGELDHPKDFEISLKNTSHVIEKIEYNKNTKQITGRIKLLNTSAGKEAKALVDAGIPLHISSRAAGVVESNGTVKIRKLFTYDLVADPGFANAQLKRVNEAFGFEEDDSLAIYDMGETPIDESFAPTTKSGDFVKVADLEKYSKFIKEHFDDFVKVTDLEKYSNFIKEHFDDLREELKETRIIAESNTNEDVIRYTNTITERLNGLKDYVEYISENLDSVVSHNDYIVENMGFVKDYAELVALKSDQGIEYSKNIAERLDETIEYMKFAVNETNSRFEYQNYINENTDAIVDHNNYIIESIGEVIKFSDYLKENIENNGKYIDYVVNEINESNGYKKDARTQQINENVNTSVIGENTLTSLDKKLDQLVESAKKQKVDKTSDLHFLNFLSSEKRDNFEQLEKTERTSIIEAMKTNNWISSKEVHAIYESALTPQEENASNWLTRMPKKYEDAWNNLSEERKNAIKAQASVRVLNEQVQIDNFWSTRELRPSEMINENATIIPLKEQNSAYQTNNAWFDHVKSEMERRFK